MSRYTSKHTGKKIDDTIDNVVNPNLLDNWYFGNPVNQRGFSTTVGNVGYTIDRWKTGRYRTGTKSMTLNDGFLSLDNQDATDDSYIEAYQPLENSISRLLVGRKITFSVLTTTGLYTRTVVPNGTSYYTLEIPNEGIIFMRALTDGQADVRIRSYYGQHMDVEAAKLELGSQQTLAHQDENGNWVLNEIPDYGEQLAKCQRDQYNPLTKASYHVFGLGTAISTTQAVCVVPVPVTMRLPIPALEINDVTLLRLQSSSSIILTDLSLSSLSNGCAKMIATVAGGLTVGQAYALTTGATNPTIIFNANQ